jgi:hypothetical protein
VTTLLAVILNMVGFDTTTQINCQVESRVPRLALAV